MSWCKKLWLPGTLVSLESFIELVIFHKQDTEDTGDSGVALDIDLGDPEFFVTDAAPFNPEYAGCTTV